LLPSSRRGAARITDLEHQLRDALKRIDEHLSASAKHPSNSM
jgi:hypothetical protein